METHRFQGVVTAVAMPVEHEEVEEVIPDGDGLFTTLEVARLSPGLEWGNMAIWSSEIPSSDGFEIRLGGRVAFIIMSSCSAWILVPANTFDKLGRR